ncbi:MAG: hypothetical protein WA913_01650 [Pricia sp.]
METNLVKNPEYADKLAEMEALLLDQMVAHDDPYRLWDRKEQQIPYNLEFSI